MPFEMLNHLNAGPWFQGSPRFKIIDADGEMICEVVKRYQGDKDKGDSHAEFIVKARAAFEIMMQRGWDVKKERPDGLWYVPIHLGWERCQKVHADDPFTALVQADAWYRENIEKVKHG